MSPQLQAPTAVAMHMQWCGARGSTFGVHMHVAPTVPTGVAAYACGFGVHMHVAPTAPTFWCAYACGFNDPNGLGCLCMWLQRRYMRRLGWYSYAVRSCICPRVTLDPQTLPAKGSTLGKIGVKSRSFCYA